MRQQLLAQITPTDMEKLFQKINKKRNQLKKFRMRQASITPNRSSDEATFFFAKEFDI